MPKPCAENSAVSADRLSRRSDASHHSGAAFSERLPDPLRMSSDRKQGRKGQEMQVRAGFPQAGVRRQAERQRDNQRRKLDRVTEALRRRSRSMERPWTSALTAER